MLSELVLLLPTTFCGMLYTHYRKDYYHFMRVMENEIGGNFLEVTQLVGCNWDLSSPLAGLGSSG